MKVKDAQFFTVVSSFLNVYLVKNRSCSSNTVKSYEDALNLLFTFLEGTKDIPRQRVSWSHFTRQNIQEFVDWLEKVRNCSRQTQLQRLAAIRSFVRYGGIVDLRVIAIQADVERIRYRKPPPALVGYLTKEELSIFLAQPNCKKRTGFRNMVFLVLMYDTAARCQEMLDLRIQDLVLHRTSPCVYFTGKGNKTRVVPILPKTAEHLRSFETLLSRIQSCSQGESKIKVGLEATGHYSYNLLGFLLDSGLATYVINPLHTNLYRKSLSLRRTKTDRIDARTIAMMLMSDVDLKSYSNTAYHNEELKSLTRYRFDKVKERAKLKSSVARLVNILFPELEKLVSSLHIAVVYALLSNYPGASYIANANTEELAETLCTASKGRYTKSKTAEIQVAAGVSIGSKMPAKSMELKHTIALIRELDKEISEVESAIDKITSQMDSPIFTIPGIGRHMGAMILAEVGDFSNFASADKLLAYAGLSPSTYQSGQLQNCYAHMEKRGSRYLRYALFNAAKYVCLWCPTFSAYLEKKRSEGKHYNVAISHAAKKLVRLIFAMQRSGKAFLADY